MRKARGKPRATGKADDKENVRSKGRSALGDYSELDQSYEDLNLEEKAQAHLNYLSELDINIVGTEGNGVEPGNPSKITAWFTNDQRATPENCQPSRTITQFRKKLTESKQVTVPPRKLRSSEQKQRDALIKVRDYTHDDERRMLTHYQRSNTDDRLSPRYSNTIFVVDQPKSKHDIIERVRSNSVNHVNSQVAHLINRTLLRKRKKLPFDADRLLWELQLSKERATRRQTLLKRSMRRVRSPNPQLLVCPKTSVLVQPRRQNLVKLSQFMRQLTDDCSLSRPAVVARKPYPRKQSRCQPKIANDPKSNVTESFANNRLVRQLYLKYDHIISRSSKRTMGL